MTTPVFDQKFCEENVHISGWVRFKINHFVTNANQCSTTGASSIDTSSSNEWTTAFYITRVDKIRAILDHGQPLPIGKNSLKKILSFFTCVNPLPLMQNHAKMLMEIKKTILDREHFCGSAHHRMHR